MSCEVTVKIARRRRGALSHYFLSSSGVYCISENAPADKAKRDENMLVLHYGVLLFSVALNVGDDAPLCRPHDGPDGERARCDHDCTPRHCGQCRCSCPNHCGTDPAAGAAARVVVAPTTSTAAPAPPYDAKPAPPPPPQPPPPPPPPGPPRPPPRVCESGVDLGVVSLMQCATFCDARYTKAHCIRCACQGVCVRIPVCILLG